MIARAEFARLWASGIKRDDIAERIGVSCNDFTDQGGDFYG